MSDNVESVGVVNEYSIDVNTDSFEDAHAKLKKLIADMEATLKQADQAGKDAVAAAGGESTRVGQAMGQSLVAVNSTEFTRVQDRINTLDQGVQILTNAYQQEEDELVKAINNYKDGYNFDSVKSA